MEVEFYQCPFCGWVRPLKYGGREVRFDKVDPGKVKVWMVMDMEGAGRGSKNAKCEVVDYKTIPYLDQELKNQIRRQCQKILALL